MKLNSKEVSNKDILEVAESYKQENSSITDKENITTCDFCGKIINFENNLSGLSIMGKKFTCEKCCQEATNTSLENWASSINANFTDIKPIALWLMQEKNKKRLF